jgi:hypothetical protein
LTFCTEIPFNDVRLLADLLFPLGIKYMVPIRLKSQFKNSFFIGTSHMWDQIQYHLELDDYDRDIKEINVNQIRQIGNIKKVFFFNKKEKRIAINYIKSANFVRMQAIPIDYELVKNDLKRVNYIPENIGRDFKSLKSIENKIKFSELIHNFPLVCYKIIEDYYDDQLDYSEEDAFYDAFGGDQDAWDHYNQ